MENESSKNCFNSDEIYDILDGEASNELCSDFYEHIKVCEKCRHEYESIKAIKTALKDCSSEPSADFTAKTLARLKTVERNPFIRFTNNKSFRIIASTAACVILALVIITGGLIDSDKLVSENLANENDINVASTDEADMARYSERDDSSLSEPENVTGLEDNATYPAADSNGVSDDSVHSSVPVPEDPSIQSDPSTCNPTIPEDADPIEIDPNSSENDILDPSQSKPQKSKPSSTPDEEPIEPVTGIIYRPAILSVDYYLIHSGQNSSFTYAIYTNDKESIVLAWSDSLSSLESFSKLEFSLENKYKPFPNSEVYFAEYNNYKYLYWESDGKFFVIRMDTTIASASTELAFTELEEVDPND